VKGVHHGHQPESGEQKDQRVAEAEVVVDGADQHHRQNDGEKEAGRDVGTMKMRRCPRTIGNCSSRARWNSQRWKALARRIRQRHGANQGGDIFGVGVAAADQPQRWRATAGSTACTSSGRTIWRPPVNAQARASREQ
jgi:hypothetical protein